MWTMIFAILTAYCGIKWLARWVGTLALLKYMLDKGCPAPSDADLKTYMYEAWKAVLHIK